MLFSDPDALWHIAELSRLNLALSVPNDKSQNELPAFSPVSFSPCLIQRPKTMTYGLEMTSSTAGRLRAKADHELWFCIYLLSTQQPGARLGAPCPSAEPGGGEREWFVYMPQEQSHVMEILQTALLNFTFAFFQLLVVPSWKGAQLLLSPNSPRLVDYLLNGNGRLKLFSLKNSSFKA